MASVLYIVPQIYGLEAADQAYLGDLPSALISSENLAVARPLFWLSLGLFALTAGVMFVPVPGAPRQARRRRGDPIGWHRGRRAGGLSPTLDHADTSRRRPAMGGVGRFLPSFPA